MLRNAHNDLNKANEPKEMLNFEMEHVMVYVEYRKKNQGQMMKQPTLCLQT
jgi:hypothetical protein